MQTKTRPTVGAGRSRKRPGLAARAVKPELERTPSFTRADLLTANDVAEALQIKRSTALDYMRRGVIPAHKIGRRWYALRSKLDAHLGEIFGPGHR